MFVAFVAGATGYTGTQTVRVLAARGERTLARVRPNSSRLTEWRACFRDLGAEPGETPWEEQAMTERFGELRPTHVVHSEELR